MVRASPEAPMKVSELRTKLATMDGNAEVQICVDQGTVWLSGPVRNCEEDKELRLVTLFGVDEDDIRTDEFARALGRRGGKKGGPARAAKLSTERRREIAIKAARARWGTKGDSR